MIVRSETKAKKEDKEDELDTLGTKIDQATAKIAKLKEEARGEQF